VVLNADRIPHVVMLEEGVCFSLEHDGNRRYPARKLWRLIDSRRIPSLLCELGSEARGSVEDVYAPLERIEGDGDCFTPVRNWCALWYPAAGACSYPYELIPLLSRQGKLFRAVPLHLPGVEREFVMPSYSREQIRARIAEVRDTPRPNPDEPRAEP